MTDGPSGAPVRFYQCSDLGRLATPSKSACAVQVRLWRPGEAAPGPDGFMGREHLAYHALHRLGIFANRDYSAICLHDLAGRPLHISYIFPRFFRFPFMAAKDLQIGATYTDPDARGQGLAQRGLIEAVRRLTKPDRCFWYLTEAANVASCAVAEKAGFKLVGNGARVPRLGIQALSAYRLTQPETHTS